MSNKVQSVVRAFDILYCFTEEKPELSAAEIADRIGLNRTTVHRLLLTLEACHAVQRNPVTRKFGLSPRLLAFSSVLMRRSGLGDAARGPMLALRDATGETVALHVAEETARIVFMQAESPHDLRVAYPRLGEVIPLHLGAPSKAILAFRTEAEIDDYLERHDLAGATPYSITEGTVLRAELKAIRERGYATSFQERRIGVASIAAPIFQLGGSPVASINVIAPLSRMDPAQAPDVGEQVMASAAEISRLLGNGGSRPDDYAGSRS